MNTKGVGEFISIYRKKKKISQIRLCSGLCSKSTVSRIEMGEIDVSLTTAQALLERMGSGISNIEFVLEEKEFQIYKIRCEIEKALRKEKYLEVEQYLDTYQKIIEKKEFLHFQYIALYRAKLILKSTNEVEKAEVFLEEAESYTMKDTSLYNHLECDIMLNKARFYRIMKQTIEEKELLFYLYRYIKNLESNEFYKRWFPEIQIEIAQLFLKGKGYALAMELIKEGFRYLDGCENYEFVAELHYLQAKVLWHLSEKKQKVHKECVKGCLQAYYLYQFHRDVRMYSVLKFLQEELEWEFID